MFKRVTKRVKRREEAEKLGVKDDLMDTDSDESESEEESDGSQDKQQTVGKKRKRVEEEEEEGIDTEDEEDIEGLSTMTVKEALQSPLEASSCILCPGKQMKNSHMEQIHLQSGHHKRRLKRFEALVKRLSSEFEDVYADQAALVLRLLEKPSIQDAAQNPARESNRAKKRQKYEELKEKKKLKKESVAARHKRRQERKKRKKASEDDKKGEA